MPTIQPVSGLDLSNEPVVCLSACSYVKDEPRILACLQTIENARRQNLPYLLVDGGSPDSVVAEMQAAGAYVVRVPEPGLPSQYAYGIEIIRAYGGDKTGIFKFEPEKPMSPAVGARIVRTWHQQKVGLGILGRNDASMMSLPPIQHLTEIQLGRFLELFGCQPDTPSGLMYIGPHHHGHWANCLRRTKAQPYAANWVYLSVMQMQVESSECAWASVPLIYPEAVVQSEIGSKAFDEKRIQQAKAWGLYMFQNYGGHGVSLEEFANFMAGIAIDLTELLRETR